MTGDPYFSRLLNVLTAPGAGYVRASNPAAAGGGPDFAVGEARYPMPAEVRERLAEQARGMDRFWYSDPRGEARLRAIYLRDLVGGEADPDTVLVTAGGKEAAALAVRFALHQQGGGPVLIPTPGWEPYRFWVEAAGAEVRGYDPSALAADPSRLRALIGECDPRPRVLVLNYPHNPTGVAISQAVMDELIAVATVYGVSVVSDEVYRSFGQAPVSAARALAFDPQRHLVVDSISKWCAAAGLRVGFVHAERRVVAALTAVRAASASCTSVLTQAFAATLLTDPAATTWLVQLRRQVAADRTDTAVALGEAGIDVVSHGALYLWCKTPDPAALPARDRTAVAGARVSGGAGFAAPEHFRVCPARAGLDPVAAAAAVVETLRTW
ncbi:pyridoxal phosphate-dependent aminotransferase [Nocardia thailandica]